MATIDFNQPQIVVAMDHARYFGLVSGLESPGTVINSVTAAGADAIMTSYGVVKHFREQLQNTPTLIRIDGGESVYRQEWLRATKWRLLHSVESARELGAAGVCMMLFVGSEVELETMAMVAEVAADTLSDGLPVMVEALPCPQAAIPNTLDAHAMASACRLAFEHGADVVKTYYTGSPDSFRTVIDNCPVPVLIAGGVKMDTEADALAVVHGSVEAGGKGVVFGRNIWQSADPKAMVQALRAVIHDRLSVADAVSRLG